MSVSNMASVRVGDTVGCLPVLIQESFVMRFGYRLLGLYLALPLMGKGLVLAKVWFFELVEVEFEALSRPLKSYVLASDIVKWAFKMSKKLLSSYRDEAVVVVFMFHCEPGSPKLTPLEVFIFAAGSVWYWFHYISMHYVLSQNVDL